MTLSPVHVVDTIIMKIIVLQSLYYIRNILTYYSKRFRKKRITISRRHGQMTV